MYHFKNTTGHEGTTCMPMINDKSKYTLLILQPNYILPMNKPSCVIFPSIYLYLKIPHQSPWS